MALYVNKNVLNEVEERYENEKNLNEFYFCVDVTKMAKNSIDGEHGLNVWRFNYDLLRKRTDMYLRAFKKIAHKNGDRIKWFTDMGYVTRVRITPKEYKYLVLD